VSPEIFDGMNDVDGSIINILESIRPFLIN
jgi:hypothetical protein